MTPGRFDNTRIYDVVLVLGDFEGKRFNAFNCNASKRIIVSLLRAEICRVYLYILPAVIQREQWAVW